MLGSFHSPWSMKLEPHKPARRGDWQVGCRSTCTHRDARKEDQGYCDTYAISDLSPQPIYLCQWEWKPSPQAPAHMCRSPMVMAHFPLNKSTSRWKTHVAFLYPVVSWHRIPKYCIYLNLNTLLIHALGFFHVGFWAYGGKTHWNLWVWQLR